MVVGEGFEPSKAVPSDLQSDPFGHSGIPPNCFLSYWCRLPESNWRPTDYKSVALPTELSRRQVLRILLIYFSVAIANLKKMPFSLLFA